MAADTKHSSLGPWLLASFVLVILGLVVALLYLQPKKVALTAKATPTIDPASSRLSDPDKTFDLVVKSNQLVSGPSAITVNKNDSVRVNIKAQGSEVHVKLDGYGINTESAPSDSTPGGFSFIADKTGEFPFYAYTDKSTTTPPTLTKIGTITVK